MKIVNLTIRSLCLSAAALALTAVMAGPAEAGTYKVYSCAKNPNGGTNSAFMGSITGTGLQATDRCGLGGTGLVSDQRGGDVSGGARATFTFTAPPGTTLRSADYSVSGGRIGSSGFASYIETNTSVLDGCTSDTDPPCNFSTGYRADRMNLALGGASFIRTVLVCFRGGCADGSRATTILEGAAIEVEDNEVPATANKGGTIENQAVQSGTATQTFDASDNTGIKQARLLVDGVEVAKRDFTCDFSRPVPCSSKTGESLSFDTRTVTNGVKTARLVVTDPAGNETSSAKTILVQNAASASPPGSTGSTGGTSSSSNTTSNSSSESLTERSTLDRTVVAPGSMAGGSAVTLKASRRDVKNGRAVGFSGSVVVDGRPFSDLIVALQARVGNRWVTFKNLRTNARGSFSARYRFTRTFRTQTYRFRAHVAKQQGHDADRDSRAVRVRVRR